MYRDFLSNLANLNRMENRLHWNAYFVKLMVCLNAFSKLHILNIHDQSSYKSHCNNVL